MMAPQRLWLVTILFSTVALACNTLTAAFTGSESQAEPPMADIQAAVELTVAALEVSATEASLQPAPDQGSSTIVEDDSEIPSATLEGGSGLPTVTLETGGFIFSTQQLSRDDRDVWWNRSELNCSSQNKIVSLGMIGNLNEVTSLSTEGMITGSIEPQEGEGFGIRIVRDGAVQYALLRVISLKDRIITFEWIYPFSGEIIEAP